MRRVFLPAFAYLSACLEPTQVDLVLTATKDLCPISRVTIYLEGQRESPLAMFDPALGKCQDLGNIVFVPSGRGDTFTVVVEATQNRDGACGATCVKATRTVSYLSHASLKLPIELEGACLGKDCGAGKTCVHGFCVNVDAACRRSDKLCDLLDGGTSDAKDAAPDVTDLPCATTGASGKIVSGAAMNHWTFNEIGQVFADTQGTSDATLAPGFTHVLGKCALGLSYGGPTNTMPLGTAKSGVGVGFVADLRVSKPMGTFPILAAGRGAPSGWMISGVGNAGSYVLKVDVLSNGQLKNQSAMMGMMNVPADDTWHHVEVLGWGSVVHFLVDSGAVESIALSQGGMIPTTSVPLELTGSVATVGIDNLWIYAGK